MAFLKILFWIIAVLLVLVVLIVGIVLFALWVKIQVGFDYTANSKRFWIKYGIFKIKIYPEMFSDKAKAKRAKLMGILKSWFGTPAKHAAAKVKKTATEKVEETKEKKSAEKDFNTAVEIKEEEARIEAEEARLNVEIPKAEKQLEAAEFAKKEGKPWPDVVNEKEVSKLDSIKTSFKAYDIEGTYNKVKDFMSGFSFDSIVALITTLGGETGNTLGKVVRKIHIKRLDIALTIGGDDAASTALKYGRLGAVIYPALGKITSKLTVHEISMNMLPDYLAKKDSGEFSTVIALRPLTLVTPFISYLPKVGKAALGFYKDYKSTKKGNKKTTKESKPAKQPKLSKKKA